MIGHPQRPYDGHPPFDDLTGYPRPQDYRVRRVTCWPWLVGLPVLVVLCWLVGR